MSWWTDYKDYNDMTISELKELLKASGLPVSGKKRDLISYLIYNDYPHIPTPTKSGHNRGLWLQTAYHRYLVGHNTFHTINYQDIYSKVA